MRGGKKKYEVGSAMEVLPDALNGVINREYGHHLFVFIISCQVQTASESWPQQRESLGEEQSADGAGMAATL